MARPKKEEKPKDSASLQVSIEDFVRTRDSSEAALECVNLLTNPCKVVGEVAFKIARNIAYGACRPELSELIITPQVVTGLATLQSAVQDLSRAYIAHTNTVIGKGSGSALELMSVANPLGPGDNVLFTGRTTTPGPNAEGAESKKRKRAPHDKNAPKRPVTPYFLYMQTARSEISSEMPPGHTAKQVADEGTKRWLEMLAEEKEKWSYKYGVNFARYKEKVKAYKEGKPIPEISDAEAKKLYDEQRKAGGFPDPPPDDSAIEEPEDHETSDASTSDDDTPEPIKARSPPRTSKRSKKDKESPVKPTPTKVVERASKSPEMERKKKSRKSVKASNEVLEAKKEADEVANSSILTNQDNQQRKKSKGRKRKSEAADA